MLLLSFGCLILGLVVFPLQEASSASKRHGKIAIIGSGNWGTAIARLVGSNVASGRLGNVAINMWVYEEIHNGRNLTDIINEDHENTKYLPGIKLPSCIIANNDIVDSCKDADVLLFVVPHQFLPSILQKLKGNVRESSIAISLIKGLSLSSSGPVLLSDMIKKELGLKHVGVLMGANIADDVSRDQFVEATLACDIPEAVEHLVHLFECKAFKIELNEDVISTELCGALKNIVAMAAGFCDGLKLGASTKAAVMRKGLLDMQDFCKLFSKSYNPSIILSSCAVADVIASSIGGRNRLCSAEFVQQLTKGLHPLWGDIERNLLGGQKLQGLITCDEVITCLDVLNIESSKFPLFRKIHAIARLGADPNSLFDVWRVE